MGVHLRKLAPPRAAHMSYQQRTEPRQDAGVPAMSGGEASHGMQGAAWQAEGAGRDARLCCAQSAAPYQVSTLIWTCTQDKTVNSYGLRQTLSVNACISSPKLK